MSIALDRIQPLVLVGGPSVRFGRNKLREPLDEAGSLWLVDRPIRALREVFGPRVALVGRCEPALRRRADAVITDLYPGMGPIGGIVSALEQWGGTGVLVLAGDLPGITARTVRSLLHVGARHPDAQAVRGVQTGRIEPCIALYFASALPTLRGRLRAGRRGLLDAFDAGEVVSAEVSSAEARNVNLPKDLR